MTGNITLITTFANAHFEPFAKHMLQSFTQFWPEDTNILVQLDDGLLLPDVKSILRDVDLIGTEWPKERAEFIARNHGKDDPKEYRKQPVRFCHKVFAIGNALEAIREIKSKGGVTPRYLIWLDADVHTIRPVTMEDARECLPAEGDAVSYMGRKDWDHSECGWMAFDLENGGDAIIDFLTRSYVEDRILALSQWHDSFVFDEIFREKPELKRTNLTANAVGRDVWNQSPMGKWSIHHKGPVEKAKLMGVDPRIIQQQQAQQGNVRVQVRTKNAIPKAEICKQIERNQKLIKNWIRPCAPTDEELVVVSAGPMLVAEDVRDEIFAGKKIVAVKNALTPLKKAGIKPWACILLDPRPHVADFVQDADPDVLWFVASQVHPSVTLELLARGCKVWGYHAAVGAGEEEITSKQEYSVVSGGSATATRGLFLLNHMGFSRFTLYGYDLCIPDKPDFSQVMEVKEDDGSVNHHPKYIEMTVGTNDPLYNQKRMYFTEPQLMAQFEEMNELIKSDKFDLRANGEGVVPFLIKAKRIAKMRRDEMQSKLMGDNPPVYSEMLGA